MPAADVALASNAASAPATAVVSGTNRPAFTLEPVRVPPQVDQPQWLVRSPDGSLSLLEQERWASPLGDEFRGALREILVRRFGAIEATSVATTAPAWRVAVEVTRFESAPYSARLEATWTLATRGGASPSLRCVSYFEEPAAGGMPELAAAHRRAVMRLGDAIGAQLVTLQRGSAGRCPD